ncbi:hypothetical protein G7046_g3337 [Stylonectria norvegica]|nr:hypothetical protein G7046_g3337 [Stylonectria norvegica]
MATMAPVPTSTTTITPPSSSHGIQNSWGYPENQKENPDYHTSATTNNEYAHKPHYNTQNGGSAVASFHTGMETATRRMPSHDNLTGGRPEWPSDGGLASPYGHELKASPILHENPRPLPTSIPNGDNHERVTAKTAGAAPEDNSKWIHRDKLARIESEELQAAGIFVPRTRASSKQRRERSRSAMRRGADAPEQSHTRSRKNSVAPEPRSPEPVASNWDLRTPDEIAEEEANAYFSQNSVKSGSRIPVAKASHLPVPVDYIDRSTPAARKPSEGLEDDTLSYQKTRSRSVSMKGSDATTASSTLPVAKRSATDSSPKKNATGPRKTSAPIKPVTATGRPKTRSGSNKDSNGTMTRPTTRSGELSPANKAPEGPPPWLVNAYKPDPRLPPDQQLLPTVARRLQQEKWEKEGKFGDVYDKDFRPLNDNVHVKPPEAEKSPVTEEESQPAGDEWPLKTEAPKSPTLRQGGSYSTMPKISDKPQHSPLPSPRTVAPQIAPHEQTASHAQATIPDRLQEQQPDEADKKEGCGCCVVMPGAWLPADHRVHREYLRKITDHVDKHPQPLVPVLEEFKAFIEGNTRVYMYFVAMFDEVPRKSPYLNDPTGVPQVRDYKHMLLVLNHILTRAPEWTDAAESVGVVGVPMCAIFDYPMGTPSGHAAFLDPDVNKMLKKVLNTWGKYLLTPESADVLGDHTVGWFGETGLGDLMKVANAASKSEFKFEDMYICDPSAKHYGYKSWDDFFTRHFRDEARPIASPSDDNVIANACESKVYNIEHNVKLRDKFFVKGQPYSVIDMLAHDPLASHFAGGTIYQAFLSALSYHRWHAPVSGTVRRAFVQEGTYFSEPLVVASEDPLVLEIDTAGIGAAQGYLSALATRAIILIEADNPKIGLMAFIGIGMDEVSTCDITVKEGQHITKGQQTGMFHFGGSSHCLLFRKGVKLDEFPTVGRAENVPVRSKLAVVKK